MRMIIGVFQNRKDLFPFWRGGVHIDRGIQELIPSFREYVDGATIVPEFRMLENIPYHSVVMRVNKCEDIGLLPEKLFNVETVAKYRIVQPG